MMKKTAKQNREKEIAAISEQTLKLATGAEDYPQPPVGKKG
jgi:hypothetical protein